jgi:sulfur-carrier protein adenylyltransferase/sulfurtransferase
MLTFDITVEDFKKMLDGNVEHQLIDCRRPDEFQAANIGGELIEMQEIPKHLDDFRHDVPLVIICRTGSRSAMVTSFLRQNGFPNAQNLQGGIFAWSDRVDPKVQKY